MNKTIINHQDIGYVVGGGLQENLRIRLTIPPYDIQEGAFVIIDSGNWRYYGLVTDIVLGATDPRFADEQSDERLPKELSQLLHGQTLYANLEILPALMLERGPEPGSPEYDQWIEKIDAGLEKQPRPIPVKTVPQHHARVLLADEGDIAEIFGKSDKAGNFTIGYTREQEHPVRINLDKFVQRSSGIFGATGTGKSFLTRILIAGLIKYDKSSVLIFDMHNEYGYDDVATDTNELAIGLKNKFGGKVQIVGLGAGAKIRGNNPVDFNLEIAESDITPEDIELLTQELNLRETTPTTLHALYAQFGSKWFSEFKKMKSGATVEDDNGKKRPAPDSVASWAISASTNVMAAEGLHNKLRNVFSKQYIVEQPAANGINEIVKMLEDGRHVILSFGKFESDLDYLLVSNLLTRRIRERWEKTTNAFRSGKEKEPRPLVIVIEEAHKLLNREMAKQTTFSSIAREMRKYYTTLIIIDQRPSQIYDEVMSQLGTRISAWLGDEDDIHAVLSGLAGRTALRGMLSHLQEKEEALLLGWGVPMPMAVRTRRYDDRFWEELLGKKNKDSESFDSDQSIKELGF